MQYKSHLRWALQLMSLPQSLIEEIVNAPDQKREHKLDVLVDEDETAFIAQAIEVANPVCPGEQLDRWLNGIEAIKAVREKHAKGLRLAQEAEE